ncbi:hypothetical protein BWGOE8_09300 [Bacillus mycoides]|uniref:Uncharacterized protein n=1 Tax=Bacillus mycoides TaxID=1405 RepID=A0A1E8BCP9_BACMY|nr:hypothetical protein BWGOE9_09140 [Bacillus mycoides]OFD84144.1 hypothetical protein BWGOE8_09300 [Bacillus mycoides]OFD86335.1 hypothetical protein BWGOE10_09220 [Bacillus mycoides]
MESSANPMDPVEKLNGLTSGFKGAFTLGLIFIVVLKRRERGSKGSRGFTERELRFILKRHL